ncbi:MAG: anaerobic glycerol-3-phosphate dehydrogenase subunit GlpB [Bacillota bacterium]
MRYDLVIIGAGLAGMSAALAAVKMNKQAVVLSKGLGSLYSSSGYIDLLGYYPTTEMKPVLNPARALDVLVEEKPDHPYSLVGKEAIREAFTDFLSISREIGLAYSGTLDENILMPTAAGALIPTCLYPETTGKKITEAPVITVVGIEELADFYPDYAADNLRHRLKGEVKSVWASLNIKVKRELNSFDIALALENFHVQEALIKELENKVPRNSLIVIPAVLGVQNWQQVTKTIEKALNCDVLEVPTLPPSVMGYRLAEKLQQHLKHKGVDFITGHPVTHVKCSGRQRLEVGISLGSGKLKKIQGDSFVLATGGILNEGLLACPGSIKESVFDLPIVNDLLHVDRDFFSLKAQGLSLAGVAVNSNMQPIDIKSGQTIYENLRAAGATLAGYDPFIEKSGNGVALASGYKAGKLAIGA